MARYVKIAAAQMGPNPEWMPREQILSRMLRLMDEAIVERADIVAYPELALTTYFPKRIRSDYDQFFETEMPPRALAVILGRAHEAGVICHVGFAERTSGHRFNTAILTDERGQLLGRFRKIHLPGRDAPDPSGLTRVYEPYYFDSGDGGFQVIPTTRARIGIAICQDRRYCETYRSLGLRGAEIILIGYNTPLAPLALTHNELVMRTGAYENHCFVVGIAKTGVEDGMELIGGSCIISPEGEILAKASTNDDELIIARVDLDQIELVRRRLDFFGRRRPEHYGAIVEHGVRPRGATVPDRATHG